MSLVVSIAEHRNLEGRTVSPGTIYECDPKRAQVLSGNGYVDSIAKHPDLLWASMHGRALSPFTWPSAYVPHAAREAWPRVLQMTRYDPGNSVYRYHSAANTVNEGLSALVRFGHDNTYCDLRQYDSVGDKQAMHLLFESADVVHVHMDYDTLETRGINQWPDRARQLLVRHYHGSQPRHTTDEPFVQNALDEAAGALQIGARLYHHRFSERMQWLPIPVPVRDYAVLRAKLWVPIDARPNKRVRICHSPTHPRIKGTIELETVMGILQARGLPVELVMIQGKTHEKALEIKATCDITFDSFWLGIQGSGLEAACMGQMVIAGDDEVREEYERYIGRCPYTFVGDAEALGAAIERAVVEPDWRASEAARVARYVEEFHDYPSVGARYWRILHTALKEQGLHGAANSR